MSRTLAAHERDQALSMVRQAIQNEVAGRQFYGDAAQHCIDPWAKEVFSTLAQDEDDHTRLLLLQHESLETEGIWLDYEAAMSSSAQVDITKYTFLGARLADELFPSNWPAGQAVDRRSDDLEALSFGIAMEKTAIDLYTRAAEQMDDAAARKVLEYLAQEETRHLDELRHRWESLGGMAFGEP